MGHLRLTISRKKESTLGGGEYQRKQERSWKLFLRRGLVLIRTSAIFSFPLSGKPHVYSEHNAENHNHNATPTTGRDSRGIPRLELGRKKKVPPCFSIPPPPPFSHKRGRKSKEDRREEGTITPTDRPFSSSSSCLNDSFRDPKSVKVEKSTVILFWEVALENHLLFPLKEKWRTCPPKRGIKRFFLLRKPGKMVHVLLLPLQQDLYLFTKLVERARVCVGVLSGTESYSLFFFKAVYVHLLVALFVLRTKEACFPN